MPTPIERNDQSKITLHLAIFVGVTCDANTDKIINYTYERNKIICMLARVISYDEG